MQDSLTFIDKDQTEIITCGVFLVDVTEGRGQVKAAKEQTDGDRFS